nr:alpha/beta hydrolase [Brevibacterium daeguense]
MIGLDGLPVESDGHQVLLFDPEHSRFAEVFGEFPTHGDDATGVDVGILIPGAGTNIDTVAGTSARALSLHDAVVPPGSSPTVAWMGGEMPQGISAARTRFAEDLGPRLPALINGLGLPDTAGTVAFGHSYGGSVLGTALREGLVVDSAVFVNAAGLGPGVTGVEDYPAAATTDFYNVSVPGDWINWTQDLVHGSDPDRADGMIQVDTGWYDEAGGITLADSPDTHSGVFDTRTTAFANMVAILQGDGARITVEGTHPAWHGGPLETPIDHPEYREEFHTVE